MGSVVTILAEAKAVGWVANTMAVAVVVAAQVLVFAFVAEVAIVADTLAGSGGACRKEE